MKAMHLRGDLLPALCRYLPEPEARLLALMDPEDYRTHVEMYVALRRNQVDLPEDLLRDFVGGMLAHMDSSLAVNVPDHRAEQTVRRESKVLWLDQRRTAAT